VSSFHAPVALILSIACGAWLGRRELRVAQVWLLSGIAVSIVGTSLFLAGLMYDLSWDGLWYHQTAVYQLSRGWNPLADPMREFVPHLQDWVRHYAKGPWYVALALFSLTGDIEVAKAAPWIATAATGFAVFAGSVDAGLKRGAAVLAAALVALNPVNLFELASYLVDGLMISFLACLVAATVRWIQRPSLLPGTVLVVSAILCLNAKQTGLAYVCFAFAGCFLYVFLRRRELLARLAAIQGMALLAGVLAFGFNPYVTNTVHRGHPFYPVLGTTEFPSLAGRGEDPIEKYETPHNLMGRNRLVRLAYAVFGRPGAQPYHPGPDAGLMVPFDIRFSDFDMYYFHDVRIAGFGPLFSGALILSVCLLAVVTVKRRGDRAWIWIASGAIVSSLFISEHTWWARYGPQLWWIPLVAMIAGFLAENLRVARTLAAVISALLVINLIPLAFVHYRWEVDATRVTRRQLALLKERGPVDIDFQYFGEPFGERLKAGGVTFRAVQKLDCSGPLELMSVSPGYPCAVRACVPER
jgi:hypothetical protein